MINQFSMSKLQFWGMSTNPNESETKHGVEHSATCSSQDEGDTPKITENNLHYHLVIKHCFLENPQFFLANFRCKYM